MTCHWKKIHRNSSLLFSTGPDQAPLYINGPFEKQYRYSPSRYAIWFITTRGKGSSRGAISSTTPLHCTGCRAEVLEAPPSGFILSLVPLLCVPLDVRDEAACVEAWVHGAHALGARCRGLATRPRHNEKRAAEGLRSLRVNWREGLGLWLLGTKD